MKGHSMLRKLKNLEEREEGFTLIELLVVVIIIGILAAIAIPVFLNQREKAFKSAVKGDLRNAATQLESHYTDSYTYLTYNGATDSATAITKLNGIASEGVTITGNVTATTYCLQGTHTGLANATDKNFKIELTSGAASSKVVTGTC